MLVLYISALSKLGQLSKISWPALKLSYFKSLSKGFVSHGVITASQIKIMSWLTFNITTVGIAELYVNSEDITYRKKWIYNHNRIIPNEYTPDPFLFNAKMIARKEI